MPAQPLIGQNIDGRLKVENPTPNPVDEIMVGILESNVDDYVASLMGVPPPQGSHPEQLLTQQIPIDWAHVQRTYAKDRTLQQTYNYSIQYDAEGNSFPTFTRDYIVRRYGYVPLTKGTALSGFVSTAIVAGGTGYDQSTVDIIASGSARIQPIISGGAVVHLAIIGQGTNTSDVISFSITGGAGSGGLGSAFVQPQTAVLTKEDFLRTPDSPLDGLWVLVRRTYTTLPGATLIEYHYDEKTNTVVTIAKTRKLTSAITPGASDITVGSDHFVQIVSAQPIDLLTSWEVVTLQPRPAAHDLASAIVTHDDFVPFEFPAVFDKTLYVDSSGVLGYYPAFSRRARQITSTYWTISTSAPDPSSIMNDATTGGILKLGAIFGVIRSGGNLALGTLSEIVYDSVTLTFNTLVIDFPGSIPDFTTYKADWVGTDASPSGDRFWRAEVSPEGSYFRWRVDLTQIQYVMEAEGTVVP